MRGSTSLAGAVVAAAVPIGAAVPEAAAATLYTQGDLVAPAETTRFVTLAVDEDIHRPPRVLFAWGTSAMPAGPSTRDVELDSPPDFDSYALIGIDSVGGVFVTFADPSFALGRPFSAVFPGFDETQVADAIRTGGPLLTDFVLQLETVPGVATPLGIECICTHFSEGAPYGTFIADLSPVPAPGAALAMVVAGTGSLLRRRRAAPPVHTRGHAPAPPTGG